MLKSNCKSLYAAFLKRLCSSKDELFYVSPLREFLWSRAIGEYDSIPKETLDAMYLEAKQLSLPWGEATVASNQDILAEAIRIASLSDETIDKLAGILSDSFLSSSNNQPADMKTASKKELTGLFSALDLETQLVPEDDTEGDAEDDAKPTPNPVPDSDDMDDRVPAIDGMLEYFKKTYDTPQKIYSYLNKHIYGQTAAKKAASVFLWNHVNGYRRTLLFAGPTGCGKTEIWRTLKKIYPLIHVIDSSRLTREGWKGDYKLNSLLAAIHPSYVENYILVFDEIDKLMAPSYTSEGDNTSYAMQSELLPLFEGSEYALRGHRVDCSNISIAMCGAFEDMLKAKDRKRLDSRSMGFGADVSGSGEKSLSEQYLADITAEDVIAHGGARPEIAGRINQIVQLAPMDSDAYFNILADPVISPIEQLAKEYGFKLTMNTALRRKLAAEAAASGMGVRYLRSRIQCMLDERLFSDCGRKTYELV